MLHFEMRNISNFVQISSVLAQRSTAPTRLLLSSRPGKGPVVWHPKQNTVITNAHFSRTDGAPAHKALNTINADSLLPKCRLLQKFDHHFYFCSFRTVENGENRCTFT